MGTELRLTTGKIPRLVVQIALPAATGYFFNVMFSVVDSWFAGQISTQALAGLSLSFPLYRSQYGLRQWSCCAYWQCTRWR